MKFLAISRPSKTCIAVSLLCGAMGAALPAAALEIGGIASVTVGGGSVSATANLGGLGATATVGGSNIASGCVGSCGATPTETGGTGGKPGLKNETDTTSKVARTARQEAAKSIGGANCQNGGNTDLYAGYTVLDRNGEVIGKVSNVTLDNNLLILGMDIKSVGGRCMGLRGGTYDVNGSAVSVGLDGSTLQ